jgi:hypothetical protein
MPKTKVDLVETEKHEDTATEIQSVMTRALALAGGLEFLHLLVVLLVVLLDAASRRSLSVIEENQSWTIILVNAIFPFLVLCVIAYLWVRNRELKQTIMIVHSSEKDTAGRSNAKALNVIREVAEKQKEIRASSGEKTLRYLREGRSGEMYGK